MEKNYFESQEKGPEINIKKSIDAPLAVKKNPFYDPEFWGRAHSPDDIYLPCSDEAISFAMAGHEIGHLVKEGKRKDVGLNNFEAVLAEEQRAWDKGWWYLEKYLSEYYHDRPKIAPKIRQSFERIKNLIMRATFLSKDMYVESSALDNLTSDEVKKLIKEKREKFFSKKGEKFKQIFEKIKGEKLGVKPEWGEFVNIVTKAVKDIEQDNKKCK